METIQTLLSRHAASSFHKQAALAEWLGQHEWAVDLTTGQVDFGRGRIFSFHVLGTESNVSGTWKWGWANTESNISDSLLRAANTMRDLGRQNEIRALCEPDLDLDEADGHTLSVIAAGVCGSNGYYRGPYEGGALFFLIENLPPALPPNAAQAINTLAQVIGAFPVDHGLAARSFLAEQGYTLAEDAGALRATSPRGEEIMSLSTRSAASRDEHGPPAKSTDFPECRVHGEEAVVETGPLKRRSYQARSAQVPVPTAQASTCVWLGTS
jgi:hypothetical protein